MIPKDNIKLKLQNEKDVKRILLSKLYKDWTFDVDIKSGEAEICDITIKLNQNGKLDTLTKDDGKIRSYVLKSSNTKQSINGVTKCLMERYIIINSNYKDYIKTKREIFNVLMANEWTGYDLRKVHHLNYKNRKRFIQKYLDKKHIKYNKYIESNKFYLINKKWWKSELLNTNNITNDYYLTYQKTLIDENKLNQIIKESRNCLKGIDINNIKDNIYYRYQPKIGAYLK